MNGSDSGSDSLKLSNLAKRFVQEYLIDLNATQAALRAGYCKKNPSNADKVGPRLLKHPKIAQAIQLAKDARSQDLEITSAKILRRLDAIGDVDIGRAYDQNGRLLPIHEIPADVRKCIASIETHHEFVAGEENEKVSGTTTKVKFWDKIKANELLGRHTGAFNKEGGQAKPPQTITLNYKLDDEDAE